MPRARTRPEDLKRPSGRTWDAFRQQLIAQWWREGRTCHYCGHGFAAPNLIEVCHLISWRVRPDLGWVRSNLAPGHGRTARTGDRRCPEPSCRLNCNYIATAPDAPRDKNGADLPFTPEFTARQVELRRRFLAKSGGIKTQRREVPGTGANRRATDPGRDW